MVLDLLNTVLKVFKEIFAPLFFFYKGKSEGKTKEQLKQNKGLLNELDKKHLVDTDVNSDSDWAKRVRDKYTRDTE